MIRARAAALAIVCGCLTVGLPATRAEAAAGVETFTLDYATHNYTVPAGVFELTVTAAGGAGGGPGGGKGGQVTAKVKVKPRDVVEVHVGGRGRSGTADLDGTMGWGGGGRAGSLSPGVGGGGGVSEVRVNSYEVIVAAGGGGGSDSVTGTVPGRGGKGGNPGTGGTRGSGDGPQVPGAGGYGATTASRGKGGAKTPVAGGLNVAANGQAGGPDGGKCACAVDPSGLTPRTGGGGGGGGYKSGGGGGSGIVTATGFVPGGAGGGGSSWADPARTSQRRFSTGVRAGDGLIRISPARPPKAPGVVAVATGPGEITVSWDEVIGTDDGYHIWLSETVAGTYRPVRKGTCAALVVPLNCTATGLTPGRTYFFKMSSLRGGVEESALSAPSKAVVALGRKAKPPAAGAGDGLVDGQGGGGGLPVTGPPVTPLLITAASLILTGLLARAAARERRPRR